jgi:hypothetical protein
MKFYFCQLLCLYELHLNIEGATITVNVGRRDTRDCEDELMVSRASFSAISVVGGSAESETSTVEEIVSVTPWRIKIAKRGIDGRIIRKLEEA